MWGEPLPERLAPPGDDSAPVTFVIVEGQTVAEVATALESQGLIVDADAFRMLARVTGQDVGMQAGSHTLSRDMSAREVLAALQTGYEAGTTVTVPEGLRLEEMAGVLEAAGVVDAGAFVALATDPLSHRDGLAAQRPVDADLEGYLFPDTYEFAVGATADAILGRFVGSFDRRFDAERRSLAAASGLTVHEIVILASIVEREAVVAAERPQIARVFLNRLDGDTRLLDADPTIQYALGYQPDINSWWKRPLTAEDLELDSPYNTYRMPGLPPGPIANPGLASLDAVLQPADGDWLYFVADGDACDGTHRFAATYEGHLQNVEAYRASGCGQ